ncbi:DNA excision repair protein ERCC-6-like [Phymastichus coffea]|uniref:DNA excision repair protein ERCC-6-like n=1 Tax=Phymastichus coffea TaxID=108790 RepID=UPI00273CA57C|nr:DNA excision repair protein ERCC-6-like [Phymastichus coffea]
MENETQCTEDANELSEVLSVQSEASILQKASEEINKLVEKKETDNATQKFIESNLSDLKQQPESNILKTRLQNQVKTGEITPFQAVNKEIDTINNTGPPKKATYLLDFEKYLYQQAELAKQKRLLKKKKATANKRDKESPPTKKIKTSDLGIIKEKKDKKSQVKYAGIVTLQKINVENNQERYIDVDKMESSNSSHEKIQSENIDEDNSGSEYIPSDEYYSEEELKKKPEHKKKGNSVQLNSRPKRVLDDGDEYIYKERVINSKFKRNPKLHKVDNFFKIPLPIWRQLYKYQRVSVKWLWELHTRNLGGLLGDEMGLGKTVQVIAFLAGLDCSELLTDGGRFRGLGPTIIICPATLLEQWVQHFHDWWPTLRVVMLHQSSTFQGSIDELLHSLKGGGILILSYTGILIHKEPILKFKWHYVILDEGHKIRNPEAKVTKIVKGFLTPHRLLLTGSPMQNSLKELWSLFDFILPGKLGTLPAFMEHCAGPITRGGYSNATRLQEATALQVATMLKNAITPYMLRRTKYDVQHHVSLPDKNEQILFCSLTEEQRQLYKQYLRSDEVSFVLHEKREGGRYRARLLVALTALRKICNHPDLFLYADTQTMSDEEEEIEINDDQINKFGHWKKSGKMTVVRSLLKIWKKQGHRVLLFTQSRQMMHILEGLIQKEKYTYLRMDGTTPMAQRQLTISKFNKDPSYFVFLLTTRVGGLGVNLTGANRVIIYDPDWNPATDAQARERAWRIGQDKNVTVYRLITAGTIEEKMYHRQVFKILLSNKVLEDPRQRRLFRTTDLTELFNLNEPMNGENSESDQLFRDSKLSPSNINFTVSKIEAMKKLASELSKKIGEKVAKNKSVEKEISQENSNKADISKDMVEVNDQIMKSADKITNLPESNIDVQDQSYLHENKIIIKTEKDEISEKKSDRDGNAESINQEQDTEVNQMEIEEGEIFDDSSNYANDAAKISGKNFKDNKTYKSHHKHKKHKKSKPDDNISALFDGERVSCLIGRRLGKSKEPDPVTNSDDQYVLSKLFSKAAVSSAFQHESVLANAVLNPEEQTLLQRAAKETAVEKMGCIRQSRKWCWKPSWDEPSEEDFENDSN